MYCTLLYIHVMIELRVEILDSHPLHFSYIHTYNRAYKCFLIHQFNSHTPPKLPTKKTHPANPFALDQTDHEPNRKCIPVGIPDACIR